LISPKPVAKNKGIVCYFCQKPGHVRKNCNAYARAEEQRKKQGKATVQHVLPAHTATNLNHGVHCEVCVDEKPIHPLFETHWCPVKIVRRDGSERAVKMLRDSGSLQSLLSFEQIRKEDYVETGEVRLIHTVGSIIEVPLVEVHIESKFCNGVQLFGLVDSLPDSSFCGLIGNDLDPPVSESEAECLPAVGAVVTRAQEAVLRQAVSNEQVADASQADVNVQRNNGNLEVTDNRDINLSDLFCDSVHNTTKCKCKCKCQIF
jgi:hypothetical protein